MHQGLRKSLKVEGIFLHQWQCNRPMSFRWSLYKLDPVVIFLFRSSLSMYLTLLVLVRTINTFLHLRYLHYSVRSLAFPLSFYHAASIQPLRSQNPTLLHCLSQSPGRKYQMKKVCIPESWPWWGYKIQRDWCQSRLCRALGDCLDQPLLCIMWMRTKITR